MYMHTHTCKHMHAHTHMSHIHAHMRAHMHAHKHTHTCRNMMYNGERVMNLWRGDKKEKGKNGEESFKPNPCGPASNNPDTKAVTLLIKFDTYGYPVYYPHSAPQSWSALLG